MKKSIIIFVVFIILIFSGCKKNDSIKMISTNFTSVVDIMHNNNNYKFKYIYNTDGDYKFLSINQPVDIDLIFEDGVYTLQNLNLKSNVNEEFIENSPLFIINSIINDSKNILITQDYNGIFNYYGTSKYGEYKLRLDNKGLPLKLSVESQGITVVFSS